MRLKRCRPVVLLCALQAVGASAPPLSGDDTTVRTPPAYNTFVPPPIGGSYIDPVFGVSIKRLSDAPNTPNSAGTGMLAFVSTEFSSVSPFNRDNTFLILEHHSYFGLYDGNGGYLEDLPFVINTAAEPRWSRTDPDILYYVSGNSLMKFDISSRTSSIVRTFSGYSAIRGRGESDISRDGDHFVFAGDEPGGLANRYVFVYEISTASKGAVMDIAAVPQCLGATPETTPTRCYDQLYIAPDNSVLIGWLATGSARFRGVELFTRDMVFSRQLTHAIGHMHVTREMNGDDVLIWINSNDAQPIENCQNGVVKVRLSDALQTCLLQLDWSLAAHITAPDGNGWVFVETYDPMDPPPTLPSWKVYTNELLQVKLDGTETRRLAHHRSRQTADYGYQPRAAVSRDGSRLVFTSNCGLQETPGYPTGYTDAYLIAVPVAPVLRVTIDDQSIVEGNSGKRAISFTVTLSEARGHSVSVRYTTGDLSATSWSDYVSNRGTLTFAPGETSRTLSVAVRGDTSPEGDETFFVNLSSPSGGAVIADGWAIGTILTDDGGSMPGTVEIEEPLPEAGGSSKPPDSGDVE